MLWELLPIIQDARKLSRQFGTQFGTEFPNLFEIYSLTDYVKIYTKPTHFDTEDLLKTYLFNESKKNIIAR